MAKELELLLLGKLQINQQGEPVSGFVSAKVQALLCYLAVTGRPHDRQVLASLLWGELPEVEAKTNLRMALSNLRKLVGPYLVITRQEVNFDRTSSYWLDVELFLEALAQPGTDLTGQLPTTPVTKPVDIGQLRQTVELYQGDFLEGFAVRDAPAFEEWMLGQRERLRQLVVQALHTLAIEHTIRGEYAAGIDYTTRLLALEPWREEGHRQLMTLLARSGQRSAALAQYEICRRTLAEELGVEPMAETQVLYERLKAAGTPRPHNLPPQPTPFIGRGEALTQIARYLHYPACRLLTIVGLGGIGKTRLALQAAAEQLDAFQDGVFFVPLVAVGTPDLLVSSIAETLNLPLSSPLEPKMQLLNYLQQKEMLLVLDNFEHLLAGAELLVDILRAAPQVKLLVTSRERLNLQEEWLLEIQGLAFPTEAGHAPLEQLANYEAIKLFLQQGQRVQTNFTLSAANQQDIVRLCGLVRGMPLGLELAATWLPLLSCREIVTEIERDLNFLATSLRNMPDRHRSMRAVFESSWHFLTEAERNVLMRLSVFRGGFRNEAAIRVAGASLPMILTLLNKSLLRRDATGRYDMHELLRQYAAEKLAQSLPVEAQTLEGHCAYYAEFLQERDKLLRSAKQVETVQEIGAELENIQAAWQRALDQQRVELLGQLGWNLWFFYEARDRFHEGLELFGRAVERLEAAPALLNGETCRVYAQMLARQGRFCLRLTLYEQAKALLQKSLPLLQGFRANWDLSFAWQTWGVMAWVQGEYTEAQQYLEQSVSLAETAGDPLIGAFSVAVLGFVGYTLGEYTQAEKLLRQSLASLREIGKLWGLTLALNYLGRTVLALGRPTEARQLLEESLSISREVGDRWSMAHCLTQLSNLLGLLGEAERRTAKQLQQESVAIFRELGNQWGLTNALNQLGQISYALGEYQEAHHAFQEALRMATESHLAPVALDVLVNLAELRLKMTPAEADYNQVKAAAIELLALALNHPASGQNTKDRAVRLLAEVEAGLPRSTITQAWERGKTRPLEAVVRDIVVDGSVKPESGAE